MNADPSVRAWIEAWLKERVRATYFATPNATDEDFERHWRYTKPETMHEGALDGYAAYLASREDAAGR